MPENIRLRPTSEQVSNVANAIYTAMEQFCMEKGIPYTPPSEISGAQLEKDMKEFQGDLQVLDNAKNKSFFNRSYLQRNIQELMMHHDERLSATRHHLNYMINQHNQEAKAQAETLLGNLDEQDKAKLTGMLQAANAEQQAFTGGHFDEWAQQEEDALLDAHFKRSDVALIFRLDEEFREKHAGMFGLDPAELKNKTVAVDIKGQRNDFAKIHYDKDGKPSLKLNLKVYKYGDYFMYPSPFRKPGSNDHTQTFKHSPWHSLFRDALGRQKVSIGNQADVLLELYERVYREAFKVKDGDDGAAKLKEKAVDINNAEPEVIVVLAKKFIDAGYRISDKTLQSLRTRYDKEAVTQYQLEKAQPHAKARENAAGKHKIFHPAQDGPQATENQQGIHSVLPEQAVPPSTTPGTAV